MKKLLTRLAKYYHFFYLTFVFIASIALIFLIFPGESRFKYEFQKGSPWRHETLIAPFNFAILKPEVEVASERDSILKTYIPYFTQDTLLGDNNIALFEEAILVFTDTVKEKQSWKSLESLPEILDSYYQAGILPRSPDSYNILTGKEGIMRIKGNEVAKIPISQLHSLKTVYQSLNDTTRKLTGSLYMKFTNAINISDFITENLYYDEDFNKNEEKKLLETLSLTRGMVQSGERIIFQGDLVGQKEYVILESLKKAYETKRGDNIEYYLVIGGRLFIIAACIVLLFFYLLYYRKDIFDHKRKLSFILLMVVLMVFMAGFADQLESINLYLVPMAILPILVRIFFDSRTAIFTLLSATLLIGYFAPNSYEYILLQIVAGIIAVFSLNKLHRRSHLVFTALYVFLSYSIVYLALSMVQEGNMNNINWEFLRWFAGSSFLILSAYPLIYIFEKLFGFVSDVTLMELSDTNQPLLRKLAEQAPGTFQHSIQVANLAEAVVHRIGGNPFLVRVGALYHDIGKIKDPEYFIENQAAGMNPHDDIDHLKSAEIIINHVANGVKLAKKYNLPEILIPFITTHHGTTQTNYFYKSYQNENPEETVDSKKFTYPGPLPQNKETAVLMLTDGIEAAARSLKEKSHDNLKNLINSIVDGKISANQLDYANLTFHEITILKETLLEKLMNVYHVRIEYPK